MNVHQKYWSWRLVVPVLFVGMVTPVHAQHSSWQAEYDRLNREWNRLNGLQSDDWNAYQARWSAVYDQWSAQVRAGNSNAASQLSARMDEIKSVQNQRYDQFQAAKDRILEQQRALMRNNR